MTLFTEPGSNTVVTARLLPVLPTAVVLGSVSTLAMARISPVSGSLTMAYPAFAPVHPDLLGQDALGLELQAAVDGEHEVVARFRRVDQWRPAGIVRPSGSRSTT